MRLVLLLLFLIFQMRKLRYKEAQCLDQGHLASKWQTQDSDTGSLVDTWHSPSTWPPAANGQPPGVMLGGSLWGSARPKGFPKTEAN